jgi:hypothetical protein
MNGEGLEMCQSSRLAKDDVELALEFLLGKRKP